MDFHRRVAGHLVTGTSHPNLRKRRFLVNIYKYRKRNALCHRFAYCGRAFDLVTSYLKQVAEYSLRKLKLLLNAVNSKVKYGK